MSFPMCIPYRETPEKSNRWFERIDIVEQMCEYGLQLLEHLFEGVVMRSKSIVQVQAKTVSERYRNSFLRAHHRVLAVVVTISACFALCCVTAGARGKRCCCGGGFLGSRALYGATWRFVVEHRFEIPR